MSDDHRTNIGISLLCIHHCITAASKCLSNIARGSFNQDSHMKRHDRASTATFAAWLPWFMPTIYLKTMWHFPISKTNTLKFLSTRYKIHTVRSSRSWPRSISPWINPVKMESALRNLSGACQPWKPSGVLTSSLKRVISPPKRWMNWPASRTSKSWPCKLASTTRNTPSRIF